MKSSTILIITFGLLLALAFTWQQTMNFGEYQNPAEQNLQTLILTNESRDLKVKNIDEEDLDELVFVETGVVTEEQLTKIATSLLQNWEYEVPSYVTDGENNYKIGDTFALMANALTYYNQSGYLPAEIKIEHMVTSANAVPIQTDLQVTVKEILEAVDTLELNEQTGIKSFVALESVNLSSPQMFFGMAEVYLILQSKEDFPLYIYLPPTDQF